MKSTNCYKKNISFLKVKLHSNDYFFDIGLGMSQRHEKDMMHIEIHQKQGEKMIFMKIK